MTVLRDLFGRRLRLTPEREAHIFQRPEMAGQGERIAETLREPGVVKRSRFDEKVHLYSAFFTDRVKRGETVWATK